MNRSLIEDLIEKNIDFQFARSAGPGGQNVNKTNTKVTAKLDINEIALSIYEIRRIQKKLINKINSLGQIVINVQEERSQHKNKEIALEKMKSLIFESLVQTKTRYKTKLPYSSKVKRLTSKKINSERKKFRKIEDN
jgi:ribosome-associated protein